jgi:hypothetical protein
MRVGSSRAEVEVMAMVQEEEDAYQSMVRDLAEFVVGEFTLNPAQERVVWLLASRLCLSRRAGGEGVVIVDGVFGSGKAQLLAALLRFLNLVSRSVAMGAVARGGGAFEEAEGGYEDGEDNVGVDAEVDEDDLGDVPSGVPRGIRSLVMSSTEGGVDRVVAALAAVGEGMVARVGMDVSEAHLPFMVQSLTSGIDHGLAARLEVRLRNAVRLGRSYDAERLQLALRQVREGKVLARSRQLWRHGTVAIATSLAGLTLPILRSSSPPKGRRLAGIRAIRRITSRGGGAGRGGRGGQGGRGERAGGGVEVDVVLVHDAHVISEAGCVLAVAALRPSLLVLSGDSRRPLAPNPGQVSQKYH